MAGKDWAMRALTLTQPWAGLVAAGIKLVENRNRKIIHPRDFGKPFAIHASREFDDASLLRISEIAPDVCAEPGAQWLRLAHIQSAVIAVATIDKAFTGGWDAEAIARHAGSISDSRGRAIGPQQIRWFFGPVGYLIRDVRALEEPVPCRGNQGFWTLPSNISDRVSEQLARSA